MRWMSVVALCALMSACGGGGSSGGTGGGGTGGTGGGGGGGGGGPTYSISVNPASVQFSAIIGPNAAQHQDVTVDFVGDGLVVGYPPGVSQPSWLGVAQVDPTDTTSPVVIRLNIQAVTYTQTATLTTTVRFVTGKADQSQVVYKDVPVTLTVRDPFRLTRSKVELDATEGAAATSTRLSVLGATINWTATPDAAWVHVVPNAAATAADPKITVDTTGLAPGTHTASIRFHDNVSNTDIDLPVSLYVSANRWNVSRNGTLLLGFTDLATPSRAVTVTNDGGATASWSASADVNWLDVTSSGGNGAALTVQANSNAAALSADTVYIANVTVTGAGLQSDQLRVGYYRSSQAAPASFESSVFGMAESIAVDPVRPYAYVSIADDHLARVNLATGAVDNVMTTSGTKLRYPVVSGDGKYLYASNNQLPGGYHVYNLDTGAAVGVWARTTGCCGGQAVWVRNRGVPALLNINLESVNAETGVYSPPRIAVTDSPSSPYLAASGNGMALFNYQSQFVNCRDVQRYEISSRPSTGQVFLDNLTTLYVPGGCLHLYSMQPTYDDSVRYMVGKQDNAGVGVLRYDANIVNVTTVPVAAAGEYQGRIYVADSGVKLVAFRDSSDNYLKGRILAADDSIVGSPFGHYTTINDVALTGDERFALLLNASALALFRLP